MLVPRLRHLRCAPHDSPRLLRLRRTERPAAQGEVKGVAIETWTYNPKVHFASTFFDTDPELPGPWSTNTKTSATAGQITNTLDSSCLTGNGCQVSQRITWVKITEAGKSYNFQITCADGGILYLDGSAIVNNDGDKTAPQSRESGARALGIGYYQLIYVYYNYFGVATSSLLWDGGDGGAFTAIPADNLILDRPSCDAGRYLDAGSGGGVCSSCNSSCSTCTGGPTRCQAFPPTVAGCTGCAAGYTLKFMQIYGLAEPCLNADGNSAGAQCVADCALLPGTFLAADGTCTACDAECASCQWPGTAAACLSCPAAAPHLVTAAGAVAAAGIAGYCEARWGTLELRLSSLTTNRGALALRGPLPANY